jgi:hypothetical protein
MPGHRRRRAATVGTDETVSVPWAGALPGRVLPADEVAGSAARAVTGGAFARQA